MIPPPHLLAVVAIASAAAAAVAVGGWLTLRTLRGRSLTVWLTIVATVTVATTLAGVFATVLTMFISLEDRNVLIALSGVAGVAGLAVAIVLGRGTARGGRQLRATVAAVGDPGRFAPPPPQLVNKLPAELADIARELERTHNRITELREREHAIESSRRELVAWVSHDLRTPLAGLRAMAEALEDRVVVDPDTVDRYHTQIRDEVDRLAAMVEDLFELARIHAGTLQLSCERVGLDVLVREAVATVDPLASAAGVRLQGTPVGELPVEADAAELVRALRNIVVNAVRHTPGEEAVEVTSAAEDGVAYVTVSDTCGGIPEEDLPRIFDVAFRGSPARTPGRGEGAGLGLAIARGIVEAHAGEIGVTNAEQGCRFVVRLPLDR